MITRTNGNATAIGYFSTPEMTEEEKKSQREKWEKDPAYIAQKNADYLIQDFNGGNRKYAFMQKNHSTETPRWYSKKEFDAMKAAGLNIKTDF